MSCVTLGRIHTFSGPWVCVSLLRVIDRSHGLSAHITCQTLFLVSACRVGRQIPKHQDTGSQIMNQNILDGDEGSEGHLE